MDAIRRFTPEVYAAALEEWAWVGLEGKAPLFTSPFGDVFFEASDGIWWLDHASGTFRRVFENRDAMAAALDSTEGQREYLSLDLALAAEAAGLVPEEQQVYAFEKPLVLGGTYAVDNVGLMDFVMALDIAGQIHQQVKGLPPGTPITSVTLTSEPASKRRKLFGKRDR